MKILQLLYSLSSGGGEKFVVDLSNSLAELGEDVTICMLLDDSNEKLTFNKQFVNPKVKFHSMKFNSGFSLAKVIMVDKYIRSITPDVVHCHLNVIPYIFPLAITNRKIKFVHTLHNVAKAASGGKYQWRINKFFYSKGLIQPITISQICKDSYEELFSLNNAPCIDNGRSSIVPSSQISEIRKVIDDLKPTEKTKVFIHVARCHHQKNQYLLIDAFNELNKNGEDFILLVLGADFDKDNGKEMQNKACARIHFLGEKGNVGDYLMCADAFCLSSYFEGLPISLLEAISCGLTPICTPVGGIPDVVKNGITGYLSKDLTKEAYIDAIYAFINKPIDKSTLIEYYKQNYSIEICAKKYLDVYNK